MTFLREGFFGAVEVAVAVIIIYINRVYSVYGKPSWFLPRGKKAMIKVQGLPCENFYN